MKTRDLDSWQGRRAALAGGNEISGAFLRFLEDWVNAAEGQLVLHGRLLTPVEALRRSVQFVETRQGRCPAYMLAQMMAVLAEHWTYGQEMMENLTPVERRLVEDVTLLKIDEVQRQAEETHNGNP